jgi:very-short-patch-repair endonuclease
MRPKKPNGYWQILENCIQEAKNHQTRTAWQKANPLSYRTAAKNGWLEQCCAHMLVIKRQDGYWTLERCKEQALKYKTKVEWRLTDRASFSRANKQGWLEDCCSHMEKGLLWFGPASILEYLISHDIRCFQEHRFKDSLEISRRPFDFYIPAYKLVIEFHGEQHRIGWGRRSEDAEQIQSRDLFKKNWALENGLEYLEIKEWEINSKEDIHNQIDKKLREVALKNNISLILVKRELTNSELIKVKSRVKWTLENCILESKKYKNIKEWQTASAGSYQAAFKKGWIDKCTEHMTRQLAPRNYWTLERCKADALKYKSRTEWSKAKPSGYSVAAKKGWLKECCLYMVDGRARNQIDNDL